MKNLVFTALLAGEEKSFRLETVFDGDSFVEESIISFPANDNQALQKGVFVELQTIMAGFLGGNGDQGMIDSRTTGLSTELERIQSRREVQDDRLLSYEENLKVRFSALDLLVSNLNSQGNFLLDQLTLINKTND